MPNHFDLMRAIATNRPTLRRVLTEIPYHGLADKIQEVIHREFRGIIHPRRAEFILGCLERRATLFHQTIFSP